MAPVTSVLTVLLVGRLMVLLHFLLGLHPRVYFLLFSKHPLICLLAAKCFSFIGGNIKRRGRTLSAYYPISPALRSKLVPTRLPLHASCHPAPSLTMRCTTFCFRWARNQFSSQGGKPLWIDPHDPSIHHIFIDDNIRLDDADTIVHPQVGG